MDDNKRKISTWQPRVLRSVKITSSSMKLKAKSTSKSMGSASNVSRRCGKSDRKAISNSTRIVPKKNIGLNAFSKITSKGRRRDFSAYSASEVKKTSFDSFPHPSEKVGIPPNALNSAMSTVPPTMTKKSPCPPTTTTAERSDSEECNSDDDDWIEVPPEFSKSNALLFSFAKSMNLF